MHVAEEIEMWTPHVYKLLHEWYVWYVWCGMECVHKAIKWTCGSQIVWHIWNVWCGMVCMHEAMTCMWYGTYGM